MCHKVTCNKCEKATWFGCGLHVPKVLDPVAEADRCTCEPKVEKEGKKYPPMSSPGSAAGSMMGAVMGMFGMGGGEKKKDEL